MDQTEALIIETIDRHREEILEFARDIYSHAELGYKEFQTSGKFVKKMEQLGLRTEKGFAITGVKAYLNEDKKENASLALLGELDALRIPEHAFANPETNAAHCCGHHACAEGKGNGCSDRCNHDRRSSGWHYESTEEGEGSQMIRDITIGQYYPADSHIHKLDPRVKIVCTLLYLISLFTFKSILGYVLATVFLFGCIKLAKVPFKFIVRGLKPIIILLLITVGFNLFLTPGGKTLVHVGFIKITEYGLSTAVYMAIRLIYLIMGSSLMTLTTTPNSLTDGLEKLLHPLNKLHVPVHEISMMMSIALRFIPILLEETDKIMKAQIARGADMESGNLIQKAKAMIPILVPLFVSAFRRANDLAMAMEARCYRGGNGRTKMKPLIYKSADHMAYLITILYVVIAFVVGRYVPFKLWIF